MRLKLFTRGREMPPRPVLPSLAPGLDLVNIIIRFQPRRHVLPPQPSHGGATKIQSPKHTRQDEGKRCPGVVVVPEELARAGVKPAECTKDRTAVENQLAQELADVRHKLADARHELSIQTNKASKLEKALVARDAELALARDSLGSHTEEAASLTREYGKPKDKLDKETTKAEADRASLTEDVAQNQKGCVRIWEDWEAAEKSAKKGGGEWKEKSGQLQQDENQLQEERDQLQEERNQLQEERDQLQEERDQLRQERDQLLQGGNQLRQERDQLQEERNQLQEERDQLRQKRDQLQEERDQNNTAQQQMETLQQQLQDESGAQARVVELLDELERGRETLREEADGHQAAITILTTLLAAAEVQADEALAAAEQARLAHEQALSEATLQTQLARSLALIMVAYAVDAFAQRDAAHQETHTLLLDLTNQHAARLPSATAVEPADLPTPPPTPAVTTARLPPRAQGLWHNTHAPGHSTTRCPPLNKCKEPRDAAVVGVSPIRDAPAAAGAASKAVAPLSAAAEKATVGVPGA
ncbi:hypothetical protein NEMBOFW57_001480 [Staphylotrichum longicolle]|uniref:Uncharacterized protein n=1 Tax=Staphylotrichum longicolle TaxID=669026 RepID=A0AAD4F180_9PEZI|nr:hypothetical protein NEMBOFW57_001480 [Staphylotrichum longicolle]